MHGHDSPKPTKDPVFGDAKGHVLGFLLDEVAVTIPFPEDTNSIAMEAKVFFHNRHSFQTKPENSISTSPAVVGPR
jgi:hypothetical protein